MVYDVSVAIVTYNNEIEMLSRTINSVLKSTINTILYIIDNSPTNRIQYSIPSDDRIRYVFLNRNDGFGSGHNEVLRNSKLMGKYHLVLNPDIYFDAGVIEGLFSYMEQNIDVGNVMPKIIYPNGDLQYLCKLLPTPMDWIGRMFIPVKKIRDKFNRNFEMQFADYSKEMNVPYLSGCFMFLRKSVIEEVGIFDEGIFMYGEDTDLNRRIYRKCRTMYYPGVTVTHAFEKGSHKNLRLFWIHVKAAIYYLNKWGWFFDKERREINKATKMKYANL